MNAFHSISSWWKRFSRKRRLSMLNATDNVEEWYTHISPAGLLAAFLAFALLLFILILSIVAYTPVLELLPGYRVEAARSRENLMQSVIRLDSMERMMNDMITYNNNIALIMEGKTPVVRTVGKEDSIRTNKTLVVPSREDSLLRAELEGEGPYSLGQSDRRRCRTQAHRNGRPDRRHRHRAVRHQTREFRHPHRRIARHPDRRGGRRRGGDESLDPRNGLPDRNTALQQPDIDL
ncbi:MAG: hypothetical protein ACLVJK_10390 [Alistipes putredinis]